MITVFVLIICIWMFIHFFDYMFRSCMFFPYLHAMQTRGITIRPFLVNCYFTRFNRTFQKMSRYNPCAMRNWFITGTVVTCLLLLPAVVLLLQATVNIILIKDIAQVDQQVLQPVFPGINLPFKHLAYYFLALLFCSIVHEAGHALAAMCEGVHLHGCGVFVLGIIPGAYVDLPGEQLLQLSRRQQLSIFCAGIWHNVVVVFLCVGFLFLNPLIFSPVFKLNAGVTVVDLVDESGLGGTSGLSVGDQIYGINKCPVENVESWSMCIMFLGEVQQQGYCTSETFINTESSDIVNTDGCANASSESLPFHCIFQKAEQHMCVPVRKLLLSSAHLCNTSYSCPGTSDICAIPMLTDTFRIFEIKRRNLSSVLFVGSYTELLHSATVSSWISRFQFVPVCIVFTYETLLKYIASFSGALAVLNAIPCPKLDGQWLCYILVEMLCSPVVSKQSHRRFIAQGLITSGCFLIAITFVTGMYHLLWNYTD